MEMRFHATLRDVTGGRDAGFPLRAGGTVRELLECAIERHPALRPHLFAADGSLAPHVHVFVDGRDVPYLTDGLDTALGGAERIDVFPPVGGG